MARLWDRYKNEVLPTLKEELGRANVLSVPRLEKIVVSMGVGKGHQEKKLLDGAARDGRGHCGPGRRSLRR